MMVRGGGRKTPTIHEHLESLEEKYFMMVFLLLFFSFLVFVWSSLKVGNIGKLAPNLEQ